MFRSLISDDERTQISAHLLLLVHHSDNNVIRFLGLCADSCVPRQEQMMAKVNGGNEGVGLGTDDGKGKWGMPGYMNEG